MSRVQRCVLLAVILTLFLAAAHAHESRPGYLELRQAAEEAYEVLWKKPSGGEVELRLLPVFSQECVLRSGQQQMTFGALVARGTMSCAGGLAGKEIFIEGLRPTITDVLVRIYYLDGVTETHLLRPASPSVIVQGTAGSLGRAGAYFILGIEHILIGIDHLLFVLGLLLIVNDRWMLAKTITSFTVAHSITLALATLGYANAPALPLNLVIALSILFLGPEIVRSWRGETSLTIRHPWIVAFLFGLLHGFGFASGLTSMGIPSAEIPLALLLFNVGVEVGQILFVVVVLLLARSFRILEVKWPRPVQMMPGYLVGTLGAYWTIQRLLIFVDAIR